MAAVDQVDLSERDNIFSLTYLTSTLATGWSTAGIADSNLKKEKESLEVDISCLNY